MLEGYKTYIAAIAAFIASLAAILIEWTKGNQLDFTAIITAFIALALLFLRKGFKQPA